MVDEPEIRRNPAPPLLESLYRDHLDPGYAELAERLGHPHAHHPPRRVVITWLVAGVVVVGALFGVAARLTDEAAPSAEKVRSGLLADVDRAQARASDQLATAASLAEQVREAQAALGVAGPLDVLAELEVAGGLTAVAGPGLRVVIDAAENAELGGGAILDRDIQVLVNGIWASGAEAVSIGGVRLRTTSAIRQAGGSILVDNRPVLWPITIEAIGSPDTMHARFISTTGFGRFNSFVQLYGIRFDVAAEDTVTLPAGSPPDIRFASVPATTPAGTLPADSGTPASSSATTAPSTTEPSTTAPTTGTPVTTG